MTEQARQTPQKQVILDYLSKVKCHPSAEKVWLAVRQKLPNISKGTVYRNLEQMAQAGKIRAINGKITCFDGDLSTHAHFLCQNCGRIYDMQQTYNIQQPKNISQGEIMSSQLYFYGICNKCKHNKIWRQKFVRRHGVPEQKY